MALFSPMVSQKHCVLVLPKQIGEAEGEDWLWKWETCNRLLHEIT